MPTKKTQVVIIGAGPTGLSMAAQLLRFNIDFIILEKNEKTTPLSKAIVVQARTLEIFKEIGIAEKAIATGRVTTAMNLFYKGKQKAAVDLAGMGKGSSAFTFALSLEQSKTEKLLADYLSGKGKIIQWKSELLRLQQDNKEVRVYYKNGEGEEQMITGDYLVGCDGASSLVRHELGLTFEGDTVPKLFYVTDVTLSSPVINKNELFIFLIEKGFVLFFPMEGTGHYRIIGILPGEEDSPDKEAHKIEQFIKTQIIVPIEFKEIRWFSTYKVHSREANSFRKGRCFIAGDAGHIHTPAGGQGMNTGIQDAYNLAWKIAYTLQYNANDSLLESYNTERMENARNLLQSTDRMFDIMAGTNPFRNFLRLQVVPIIMSFISTRPVFNRRVFPLISQTGIAYPHSTLTIKSQIEKIKAGDRMPYFVFSDGKEIFDYLEEPVFKLLFFGSGNKSQFDDLKELRFRVATFFFDEIPKKRFGSSTDFYILLRPDNHISYIGKNIGICLAFLKNL